MMRKLVSTVRRKTQRGEAERPSLQIGGPSYLILQIPRPRLDASGIRIQATDHEIDRDTMRVALTNMAVYLGSQGQAMHVIAVGGAVNVLLLRSRQSTHDLDFLGTHLTNSQRATLDEAARFAEAESSRPLGAEWFNNQTQMWLSPPLHRQLTGEALQQNEIVFQHGGLTVIAAPWMYALASKTHRIAQARRGERAARARPYDITDAAAYLHAYIEKDGRGALRKDIFQARCLEYGFRVDAVDLETVNNQYRHLYHANGLID